MNDGMTWRRLERSEPAQHRMMSFAARTLRDHLVRYPEGADGVILSRTDNPIEDLCRVMGVEANERRVVRKAIAELLREGFLTYESCSLAVKNFGSYQGLSRGNNEVASSRREAQRSLEAERKAAYRAKKKAERELEGTESADGTSWDMSGTCPGQMSQEIREEKKREDTHSEDMSGTMGHGTTGHGTCPSVGQTEDTDTRDTGHQDTREADRSPASSTSSAPSRPAPRDRMAESFAAPDERAIELFAVWQEASGKTGAKYDSKRRELFERIRLEGVTADEIRAVIAGAKLDNWAVSRGLDPAVTIGSASQREKFTALLQANNAEKPKPSLTMADIGVPFFG